MQRFVGWLGAIIILVWASAFTATTASAVIIRPAVSGLPGVTVTPGFSMSFYVPRTVFFFLPNPDYPTNPNNVGQVERFLEQSTIIGRDVQHVGGGSSNRRNNPAGQIYVIDVKNFGILTFFYPTVINNFVVSLPAYVGRINNIQWDVFELVQIEPPAPPAVPVPPAVFLLGSGIAALATLSRKRKRAATLQT